MLAEFCKAGGVHIIKSYTNKEVSIEFDWRGHKSDWSWTIDDAKRIEAGLVSAVDGYKRKLADEKREAERLSWVQTNRLRREAEEKARTADASNIEAQREADAAKQAAMDAEKAAQAAKRDQVKGLRTVTHHEVVTMRDLVNWIATHDKDAMADFATEYARKNHSNIPDDIVRMWQTREAY